MDGFNILVPKANIVAIETLERMGFKREKEVMVAERQQNGSFSEAEAMLMTFPTYEDDELPKGQVPVTVFTGICDLLESENGPKKIKDTDMARFAEMQRQIYLFHKKLEDA